MVLHFLLQNLSFVLLDHDVIFEALNGLLEVCNLGFKRFYFTLRVQILFLLLGNNLLMPINFLLLPVFTISDDAHLMLFKYLIILLELVIFKLSLLRSLICFDS